MSTQPPIHELEFLKRVPNHGELNRKLNELQLSAPALVEYAQYICECWFHLAENHLAEAERMKAAGCNRATFSRAYYAAYNDSKAVRYLVNGTVSLNADDHKKAPELPDDFPNPSVWSQQITMLYENRLRADYDNWSTTVNEYSMTEEQAVDTARGLLDDARIYLTAKFGIPL